MRITKNDFLKMLNDYKTTPSKKSFCTRCINQQRSHISNLEKAYKERKAGTVYGWYLGDKIFSSTVSNAKSELQMMINVKNQL